MLHLICNIIKNVNSYMASQFFQEKNLLSMIL